MPPPPKRFVYILRSIGSPERRYIGVTSDVASHLSAHNAGQDPSTTRWKPWFVDVWVEFRFEPLALRFEKYLKSGSSHAFPVGPSRPLERASVPRAMLGSMARRLFIAAIIAISLGAPVVEMFDRWDQPTSDLNDTEANFVIVALCAGMAFAIGAIVAGRRIPARSSASSRRVVVARVGIHDLVRLLVPVPTGSPPTVLRA